MKIVTWCSVCLSIASFACPPALRAQQTEGFPDVPKDHWAYQAVTDLKRRGILVGYPAGTYQQESHSRPRIAATKTSGPRAAQQDDIREAVFRDMFARHGRDPRMKIYFLENLNRPYQDPPAAFLKRFAGNTPPVKGASQVKQHDFVVRDRRTGEQGMRFWVSQIRRITPMRVRVRGGYDWNGRAGSMIEDEVARSGDRWVVRKETITAQF